jgi:hypothetical protein
MEKRNVKFQHKKNLYKLSDTVPVGIYFHMVPYLEVALYKNVPGVELCGVQTVKI